MDLDNLTKEWQVSRHTPTLLLSYTRAMMSRRSSNVEPMTLPVPAMFSRTVLTVLVERCAALRRSAIRAIASGRGEGPVFPGLRCCIC